MPSKVTGKSGLPGKISFLAVAVLVCLGLWGVTFPEFLSSVCAEDAVYYIYNDHLGTPVKATDEAGNVVWDGEARPFGETEVNTGILPVNVRFPGQYYDRETGLHYNYQRTYHPGLGRYLEPDPLGQRDHSNVYPYVLNDPINLIDPLGLITTIITISDYGVGTHSAIHVDNSGSPVLYDPSGSYRSSRRGSGDFFTDSEANLQDYIKEHLKTSKVTLQYVDTSQCEEAKIAENIENAGGAMPFFCAPKVSSVLDGVGPFTGMGIRLTPGGLMRAINEIQ